MQLAYITLQGEDRIATYSLENETGDLTHLRDTYAAGGPAPFAVSPNGNHGYVGLRSSNKIISYDIDNSDGTLTFTGASDLESDPCYLSVDATGRYLLSAYYEAGHIATHRIDNGGVASTTPVEWIGTRQKAHCAISDPSNQFVFLPHVGESNAIYQFKFNELTGALTPNSPAIIEPTFGDGPRHYDYHPNADFVYFDNEQGCSVTAYRFETHTGRLEPLQTVSTLPDGWSGDNSCAQIHMAPSGRFLYSSNRGHNCISIFAVEPVTGRLTSTGQKPTVAIPRAFNIDPTGTYMLVAGLALGDLATYRIDPDTGVLNHLATQNVGDQPMWIHITDVIS